MSHSKPLQCNNCAWTGSRSELKKGFMPGNLGPLAIAVCPLCESGTHPAKSINQKEITMPNELSTIEKGQLERMHLTDQTTSPVTILNGTPYMTDIKGRLTPVDAIKPIDMLRDETVINIAQKC